MCVCHSSMLPIKKEYCFFVLQQFLVIIFSWETEGKRALPNSRKVNPCLKWHLRQTLSPEILAIIPLNGPNRLYITGHFDPKFVLVYKHLFVLIRNEKETKPSPRDIKVTGPCRTWFEFIRTFSYLIFIGATSFFSFLFSTVRIWQLLSFLQ